MELCGKKAEVAIMRILTLLLHDERFSGWTVKDKLTRHHFSLQYLRFCRERGWEPLLYTFHQQVGTRQAFYLDDVGVVKIFPVKFRFPLFLRFGNDHNPKSIMQEALGDEPDLVHFHNYYLFSFPYTAFFVKEKLKRPLTVQLHSYNNSSLRKWLYLPCLLALKKADRIFYSYLPEESMYRKVGVLGKAVRVPVPGIDSEVFMRKKRHDSNRLLYVGRIPNPEMAYGEKSPFILIHLLRSLLRKVKDVALDIVGDGPGLYHCRQLSQRLRVENHIAFHGYVPYDELAKYYQGSMLSFSPIRVYDVDGWFDGTIQESLACGTPVAAFKASSKTPLRGTYGFLLSNDVEKAAAEVSMLLKEPGDMFEVAEAGLRFVHENCVYAKLAAKLQETWESVAKT
jgi:glycosyltransferase involved in cell wall biosynthesis